MLWIFEPFRNTVPSKTCLSCATRHHANPTLRNFYVVFDHPYILYGTKVLQILKIMRQENKFTCSHISGSLHAYGRLERTTPVTSNLDYFTVGQHSATFLQVLR